MLNEMIDEASTIQRSNSGNATGLNNVSPCENISVSHEVSPIIDADQERKAALLNSRKELCNKIADITREYEQRRDVVLAPLLDALTRTDEFLEDLDRPLCFGTYTCSDRDLENCPVKRSAACYRVVKGCC